MTRQAILTIPNRATTSCFLMQREGKTMHTELETTTPPAATSRPVKRKTRITIYLDDEVLQKFRTLSEQSGKGYQTLINAALRTRLAPARLEGVLAE